MHPSQFTESEQTRFDLAMDLVSQLRPEEQLGLVEAAVAAAIHHDSAGDEAELARWARGLLTTLRLHGSKAYRAAVEGHQAPERPLLTVSATTILAAVDR